MWVCGVVLMRCVCADELNNTMNELLSNEEGFDDRQQADALDAQLQTGSGANAVIQNTACELLNTSIIVGLKNKIKELADALATKTRQLVAAEQANITLHGVELDNIRLEEKMHLKNELIQGLKLELPTLKRKVVSYANATLGMCLWVCVCACACVCVCVCVC